jgi:hypothetical protein
VELRRRRIPRSGGCESAIQINCTRVSSECCTASTCQTTDSPADSRHEIVFELHAGPRAAASFVGGCPRPAAKPNGGIPAAFSIFERIRARPLRGAALLDNLGTFTY